VDTVTHGVKLSLIVSRNVLPQDALVPVTIVLRNLSSGGIYTVNGAGSPCPTSLLAMQVITHTGAVLPASPIPNVFAGCNPLTSTPEVVPRGMGIIVRAVAVLRGTGLRAEAWLRMRDATVTIYSSTIRLKVVKARHPTFRIEKKAGRVYAVFSPKLRGYEWLPFMDSYACARSMGGSMFAKQKHPDEGWSSSRSVGFTASCKVPRQWHLVAGYLYYPVAFMNYKAPSG
jgi:hypothetical protein